MKLSPEEIGELIAFLTKDRDVFAWTSADMPSVPTSVVVHKFSTNLLNKSMAQKRCLFEGKRLCAIKE